MLSEVAQFGTVLGLKAGGRKRSATLSQDAAELDVNADNFDAPNPEKRPPFWVEVRTKRVMLKEHMDRINGMSESSISDLRPVKEVDEDILRVDFRSCLEIAYRLLQAEGYTRERSSMKTIMSFIS